MSDRNSALVSEVSRRLVEQVSPDLKSGNTTSISSSMSSSANYASSVGWKLVSLTRSVLAYLDLVDDETPKPCPNEEAQDDYFQKNYQNVELLEASVDDARRRVRSQPCWNTKINPQINDDSCTSVDTLSSQSKDTEEERKIVSLMDDCVSILHLARSTILQYGDLNHNYSMSSLPLPCSATYEPMTKKRQSSTASNSTKILHGIILHRNSYDPYSFYSFYHKSITSSNNNNNNSDANESESLRQMHIHIQSSFDILMHILVAAGLAVFSEDADAIIILPLLDSITNVQEVMRNTYLEFTKSKTAKNAPSMIPTIQLNEMDVAIFKLTHASWALEQRIIQLKTSIDTIQKQALFEQEKKNTHLALIQMRRRKMLMEEMDRLQSIVLNMETGLQSLHRAKSNVHVVKSYELLHSTMKQMDGLGLSSQHVQELMDSIRDSTEELNWIHQELAIVHSTDGLDTEELEREFQALEIECANENKTKKAIIIDKDCDLNKMNTSKKGDFLDEEKDIETFQKAATTSSTTTSLNPISNS